MLNSQNDDLQQLFDIFCLFETYLFVTEDQKQPMTNGRAKNQKNKMMIMQKKKFYDIKNQ